MALSRIIRVATGSSNTFAVSFALGYDEEADVTAQVEGEVGYRNIDFSVPGFMTIDGDTVAADTNVIFLRTVPRTTLEVDWQDGASFTGDNLDKAQLQALRLVHEALDRRFEGASGDMDMNGYKITNVGTPTDDGDAVNKEYVDAELPGAVEDAQAAAAVATTMAGTATTQAGIAAVNAAETEADKLAAEAAKVAAEAAAASIEISSDPDLSVDPAKLPTRSAVKTYADAKVSQTADRASLADLSGASEPIVFVQSDQYIWDGSDLSAEVTADVAGIYIPPTGGDGSTGAWVMAGAAQTGTFATNQSPPVKTHHLAGRVFMGAGAPMDGTWIGSGQAPQGITEECRVLHGWIPREATVWCDATQGKYGLVGHSQGSLQTNPPSGIETGSIGVVGATINDGTKNGWGGYFEATKFSGAAFTVGVEIGVANLAATSDINPINAKSGGASGTVGLWLQCGNGFDVGGYDEEYGAVNDSAAAQVILSSYADNSIKFGSGIVFAKDALRSTGGIYRAIEMPHSHRIAWYADAGTVANFMHGTENTLSISNNGTGSIALQNVNGGSGVTMGSNNALGLQVSSVASGVNRLTIVGSAIGNDVLIAAAGTDTDIYTSISGKGTRGVKLNGGGAAKVEVNTTGIGFFATTPVAAKTGWGVPTGTFTRTTFATSTVTLPQLAERVAALIQDLHQTAGYGLLRT